MDQLAAHLYLTVPWVTSNRILSGLREVKGAASEAADPDG
jgi:hypothetical protein